MMTRPHWTLDRRIPVAIVVAIFLQTIGLIWYMAKLDSRVEAAALRSDRNATRIEAIESRQTTSETTSARLEERLISQGTTLARIERILEQIYARRSEGPTLQPDVRR